MGKSTLVNRMVGEHVAAVSDKPQTTRRRQLGVVSRGDAQLVLVDLPGFQKPFDRLTERMQRSVDETLEGVDAVGAAARRDRADRRPATATSPAACCGPGGMPCLIVLNKVDRLQPAKIGQAIEAAAALAAEMGGDFVALHPVSALTGDGVDALVADLVGLLPGGPAYFPAGVVSDQTRRAADRRAGARGRAPADPGGGAARGGGGGGRDRAEAPRASRSCAARWSARRSPRRAILVGKGGSMMSEIGTRARPAVERILGGQVHLELTVRVRRHWRRDEAELDRLGV